MVVNEDILQVVGPGLESFQRKYVARLQSNVDTVFESEALPALKAAYLETYDRLAETVEGLYPARIKGKDPLSLVSERPLFVAQLDRELAKASFAGGEFSLSIKLTGETDADGAPTTPDSLNFYIEGNIGESAFITPEHLKQRRSTSTASRGRVGKGFLISRRNYSKERWEELTGVPFAEVRHPISGFRPFTDFAKVPASVDFGGFVRKAVEKTNSEFSGGSV